MADYRGSSQQQQQPQSPAVAPAPAGISPRRASGMHQRQPTRIKSFFRQNQTSSTRKVLIPTLYFAIAILYFYNLFLRDVGSGVHVLRENDVDGNITEAMAPIWGLGGDDDESSDGRLVRLEPRSLADVAIANAEVAWKQRVDYQDYRRREAEMQEDRRKKREEAIRKMEKQENSTGTASAVTDDLFDVDVGEMHDSNATAQKKILMEALSKNSTRELTEEEKEYVKKISDNAVKQKLRQRRLGQDKGNLGFFPLFIMVFSCSMFRLCMSLLIGQTVNPDDAADSDAEDGAENNNAPTTGRAGRAGLSSFVTNLSGGREAVRLRRRARAQRANRQFQRFVDRLNAEREANGEREISADTLRHVVNSRDFNGNDYDRLHSFVDENGPAMGSFFSAMGATEAEINRCPSRALRADDDMLKARPTSGGPQQPTCSICLEPYQAGEIVRTIPCFHTFHKGCIDPWCMQRAECPVCKHSAIG